MMIKRDGRTDVIRQAAECLPSDFSVRKQFSVVLIVNVNCITMLMMFIILHRIFLLLEFKSE